jgi:prophage regulatory protein
MVQRIKYRQSKDVNPDALAAAIAQALAPLLTATQQGGNNRLVYWPELEQRIGKTEPTIWAWMLKGKFPRSRQIGTRRAWLASEIDEWIKSRRPVKLKGEYDDDDPAQFRSPKAKRRENAAA